jgi:hypothetical protein
MISPSPTSAKMRSSPRSDVTVILTRPCSTRKQPTPRSPATKSASPALATRLNAPANNCVVICGGRLERIMLDRCNTATSYCAGLGDCRPVPAIIPFVVPPTARPGRCRLTVSTTSSNAPQLPCFTSDARDSPLSHPTTGIAACCARAVSGHAAAPPSSVMKSRRLLIRSPRRRGRAASAALRGRDPARC